MFFLIELADKSLEKLSMFPGDLAEAVITCLPAISVFKHLYLHIVNWVVDHQQSGVFKVENHFLALPLGKENGSLRNMAKSWQI